MGIGGWVQGVERSKSGTSMVGGWEGAPPLTPLEPLIPLEVWSPEPLLAFPPGALPLDCPLDCPDAAALVQCWGVRQPD